MSFMKDFIIYEKGETKVYIHQCHNKGKKTKLFTIRRDDDTGYGRLLGVIRFNGAWRQYVVQFEPETIWSSGCKKNICKFEDLINGKWRKSWKKR